VYPMVYPGSYNAEPASPVQIFSAKPVFED
jgi:hypothetical protein